jgi:predicted MPP superfamily phosphohydrolase
MEILAPALACPLGAWGILGNHDAIEEVPYLERLGIRMLVNESVALERDGQQLWLVGLDDPHFYGTHDFQRALSGVPAAACKIGLIHSPEISAEAKRHGIALYLAGHTHGGQLCLPGGHAPYQNARCPARLARGEWREGRMVGYTSVGAGSSGLPARLNCDPEIALLELQPA